jgi:hypothetical protein
MNFKLNAYNRDTPEEELLADLKAVASRVSGALSQPQYRVNGGKFHPTTFARRFGSWNAALERAGVMLAHRVNTPDAEWFANIAAVWNHLGRQPTYQEMRDPPSIKSPEGYAHRFGGWRKALEAFVSAMDAPSVTDEAAGSTGASPYGTKKPSRRTAKTVNWRLRFLVLRRDGFKCKACGRSPANEPRCELEVDHILSWSRGGETTLDNLQSLCEKCNGGKSNLAFTAM